jgi:hypothetical protein
MTEIKVLKTEFILKKMYRFQIFPYLGCIKREYLFDNRIIEHKIKAKFEHPFLETEDGWKFILSSEPIDFEQFGVIFQDTSATEFYLFLVR